MSNSFDNFFEQRKIPEIYFGIGALKSADIGHVLPSLIELGIDGLYIFLQPKTPKSTIDNIVCRLFKISITAIKQSKSCWLPEIKAFASLEKLLESLNNEENRLKKLFLDNETSDNLIDVECSKNDSKLLTIIGNELGLSDDERNLLLNSGFDKYRLGPNVLRTPTAAIAGSAILTLKREKLYEKSNFRQNDLE